jgi:putative ABC transport system permease protein
VPQLHLADFLHAGSQSIVSSHARLRRALVVLEVAIALVLVFAAGLVGRSLAELSRVQPGFQTDRVLTVSMLLLPSKYPSPQRRVAFLRTVLENVRSTPGVISAGAIHFLPLAGLESNTTIYRSDRPAPGLSQQGGGPVSVITPGYLSTMGIRLSGRDFNDTDRIDTPRVAIVNESLANRLFPNESPLGKYLTVGWSAPNQQFEIVGVAGDVRTSTLDHQPEPAMYIAQSQEPSSFASFVVRTNAPTTAMMPVVRAAVAHADADQGVSSIESIEAVIVRALARPRAEVVLLGTVAFLALVIAGVGVYGVMSYSVQQRRREMGLRLALGASPRTLVRLVVTDSVRLAGLGTVVGVSLALAFNWSLSGLLYKTGPHDPAVLSAVAVILFAIAVLSALVPARAIVSVDPVLILRND